MHGVEAGRLEGWAREKRWAEGAVEGGTLAEDERSAGRWWWWWSEGVKETDGEGKKSLTYTPHLVDTLLVRAAKKKKKTADVTRRARASFSAAAAAAAAGGKSAYWLLF